MFRSQQRSSGSRGGRLRFAFGLLFAGAFGTFASAGEIDFARDVQPILSDNCYACHGPDAASLKADLRLDRRESALEHAVVPGKPEESELVRRINAGPLLRMPPVDSDHSLIENEKQILEEWIRTGAEYSKHWSFRPLPDHVEIPSVGKTSWPENPIDNFVLARLEKAGVEHSPPADPLRWLRRVTFDLTGLPPTLDEIAEFNENWSRNPDVARAKAVDRLLGSPAYGEQMAVAWLDAARYADSFGLQSDQLNTQWPYRDWVVRAFNKNLPYDKFATYQLAGDLLENPTRDQILATAFNRLHRMTNEGGSIRLEWRVENAADRVETFSTAFLGLTVQCARCHDHKFDPILARDYYSLFAFFNSIDENGLYDHAVKVPSPSLLLPTFEQEQALETAKAEIARAEQALKATIDAGNARFGAWLKSAQPVETLPDLSAYFRFDEEKQPFPNLAPGGSGVAKGRVTSVPGARGAAVEFDGDNGLTFKKIGRIDRWTPFTIDFWLRDPDIGPETCVVMQQTFGTDVGYNGFDIMLEEGRLSARLYRVWPGNAIGIQTVKLLKADQWHHVSLSYNGASEAEGLEFYINGKPVERTILRDHKMLKRIGVDTYREGYFTLGARFRDRGFEEGRIDEFRLFDRALSELEIAALADGAALARALADPEQHTQALREYYFSAIDTETRARRRELRETRKTFVMTQEEVHEVSVMRALPEPRPAYLLKRGDYNAPRAPENRVYRDTLSEILPPFPEDAPRNRLGLAQWLTDPDHPLTARVFVNRVWAKSFGQGIVTTPADFGRQGARPTHPQLLDWLARDFVESGWDMKHLCRRIVLSATYAQASRRRPQYKNINADNHLLARGPSRRLTAEQIRDLALASSGLLVRKIGGPPVSPYQPGKDLWIESNSMSPPYQQSTGVGLYRRSLYSVRKRTAPLPNMIAFDAPTREVCVVDRSQTNTPMQALVLLNDVQFVEAARHLAAETIAANQTDRERIEFAFRRVCGRRPDDFERTLLLELLKGQRTRFHTGAQDAQARIEVGDSTPGSGVPPEELAALAVVCQTILNLDAAIWLR